MISWWPAIVFGGPSILVALGLSMIGIARRKPILVALAVLIAIPFAIYLVGNPGLRWIGMMIPLLLIGASLSVRFHHTAIAWSLLLPIVAVVSLLAISVMGQ